jgi:hypothetical protein
MFPKYVSGTRPCSSVVEHPPCKREAVCSIQTGGTIKKPRQLPSGAKEVFNLKEKAMEPAAGSLHQSPK